MTASRLLPLAAGPGAWNMAVDEAILRLADRPTLRFYGWDPPAISLGRFQVGRVERGRWSGSGMEVVRRMTGGGAIVHWHELTYSLYLPLAHPILAGGTARESYARLHAPIQAALAELGVEARARPGADAVPGEAPVLCFARATLLDLVAGGRKLVGSAQRRTAGRMMQHGSIILEENPLQTGTASLVQLLGRPMSATELAPLLAAAFARALGPLEPGELTAEERTLADRLAAGYSL